MPIICGFFHCQNIKIDSRRISVGVISRRSRFCAGPRFLKRGINPHGDVANEVETELFSYEIQPFSDQLRNYSTYIFVN